MLARRERRIFGDWGAQRFVASRDTHRTSDGGEKKETPFTVETHCLSWDEVRPYQLTSAQGARNYAANLGPVQELGMCADFLEHALEARLGVRGLPRRERPLVSVL